MLSIGGKGEKETRISCLPLVWEITFWNCVNVLHNYKGKLNLKNQFLKIKNRMKQMNINVYLDSDISKQRGTILSD